MTRVGFLGLGSMGGALVRRLLETGHEVVVWNRSPGAVDALVAEGAVAAAAAAEALTLPLSLSMLAHDAAARDVLGGDALQGGAGRVHVNLASISVPAADELAAAAAVAGVGYVSAPVLGRPPVARAGQLNVLAAGAPEAVASARPVLEAFAKRVWDLGAEPRRANAVKIAVNYNLLHTIQSLGESIALVERQGVEPTDFVELLSESIFGGIAWTGYGAAIARRDYEPPGFGMALGLKDLGLAEELAREGDLALPTSPVLRAVFERALAEDELRDVDWAAAAEVTRRGLLPD